MASLVRSVGFREQGISTEDVLEDVLEVINGKPTVKNTSSDVSEDTNGSNHYTKSLRL